MKPDALGRFVGRCERIRTFDPLHPMQVRYQAAPHTEARDYSLRLSVVRTEQLANFFLERGVELFLVDLDRLETFQGHLAGLAAVAL
jgi:hypothetical protein